MIRGLLVVGLGAAAAVYFLDENKGRKRRKEANKKVRQAVSSAGDLFNEYSAQFNDRAAEWSEGLPDRAKQYAGQVKELASGFVKNGNGRWSPSARLVGALGSALAFYGVGRRGLSGAVLRTLSLGMFTRALIASRG
jgi:gas vesicle protein